MEQPKPDWLRARERKRGIGQVQDFLREFGLPQLRFGHIMHKELKISPVRA
jgi:hypothetical protein